MYENTGIWQHFSETICFIQFFFFLWLLLLLLHFTFLSVIRDVLCKTLKNKREEGIEIENFLFSKEKQVGKLIAHHHFSSNWLILLILCRTFDNFPEQWRKMVKDTTKCKRRLPENDQVQGEWRGTFIQSSSSSFVSNILWMDFIFMDLSFR